MPSTSTSTERPLLTLDTAGDRCFWDAGGTAGEDGSIAGGVEDRIGRQGKAGHVLGHATQMGPP